MQYIFIASETTKKKLTALSVLCILKVKYTFFSIVTYQRVERYQRQKTQKSKTDCCHGKKNIKISKGKHYTEHNKLN